MIPSRYRTKSDALKAAEKTALRLARAFIIASDAKMLAELRAAQKVTRSVEQMHGILGNMQKT